MSYIWTKEDTARLDRTRSHPTDLQKLFHSELELAYQGCSPWLSNEVRHPASLVLEEPRRVRGLKAHLPACALGALPANTVIVLQPCDTPHQLGKLIWRDTARHSEWLPFVESYRERSREQSISLELSRAIQISRGVLQLHEDWDSEGSPGYAEATWARATTFLLSNALRYWRDHQEWLITPRILPGPDGNIDLHWKTPQRELLISIPADPAESAAYYGDDKEDGTDNAIRGKSLDTSQHHEWIFAWLMR